MKPSMGMKPGAYYDYMKPKGMTRDQSKQYMITQALAQEQ